MVAAAKFFSRPARNVVQYCSHHAILAVSAWRAFSVGQADGAARVKAFMPRYILYMYLNFVDDEDLVGCQRCYNWPEYRNRSGDDGKIDLENGKDVHDRCVE